MDKKIKKLYAVFFGGKIRKENLIEDHQIVFIVASTDEEARSLAKEKWDASDIHIDGTQILNSVDGYNIKLEKTNSLKDDFVINNKYSK